MTSWLNRFGHWLFVRPWWVWATFVVVVGILAIHCRLSLTGEASVRITGLVFQLLGLWTVAKGLKETRELFGRPGVFASLIRWLRDAPRFTPKLSISVSNSATIGISTRVVIAPASIEERLTSIERQLADSRHLGSEALTSEGRTCQAADQAIQRKLEEFAAGGLHLETIGLIWIFIGIILATISVEIDTLYKSILNYRLCFFSYPCLAGCDRWYYEYMPSRNYTHSVPANHKRHVGPLLSRSFPHPHLPLTLGTTAPAPVIHPPAVRHRRQDPRFSRMKRMTFTPQIL
jgi:hypothetical protein